MHLLDSPFIESIESYRRWSSTRINAISKPEFSDRSYHYTDGRGLFGILDSCAVRFTDYRHLNDPSELKHGVDCAMALIQSMAFGANWVRRCFLAVLMQTVSRYILSDELEVFIASFSREKDDLGQWRAYADDGRGFAIGSSPDVFTNFEWDDGQLSLVYAGPVHYEQNEIIDRHRIAVETACELVEKLSLERPHLVYHNNSENDAVITFHLLGIWLVGSESNWLDFLRALSFDAAIAPLIWNCLTTKHLAYAHEKEFRLAIFGSKSGNTESIAVRLRGHIFRFHFLVSPKICLQKS